MWLKAFHKREINTKFYTGNTGRTGKGLRTFFYHGGHGENLFGLVPSPFGRGKQSSHFFLRDLRGKTIFLLFPLPVRPVFPVVKGLKVQSSMQLR